MQKSHLNPKTGLKISFVGWGDRKIFKGGEEKIFRGSYSKNNVFQGCFGKMELRGGSVKS